MTKTVLLITRTAQGGMKNHLQILSKKLGSYNWKILMAGPDPLLSRPCEPSELDLHLPINDGLHPGQDWQAVIALRRYLRGTSVDLIHAHGWKAALVAELARWRMLQVPVLVTIHNALPPQFGGWKGWLMERIGGAILRGADRIIVVSPALKEMAARIYPPAAHRIHLVPNGVDVPYLHGASLSIRRKRSEVLKSLGIAEPPRLIVGTVARIIREKGVFELVQAFDEVVRNVPSAGLLIIGDGPERERLTAAISSLKAKNTVHFLGWIDNAASLMGLFDIFVLPSWSEGMPVSIMEAMAAGVPVVASCVGGIPDLVSDGITGRLVPVRDTKTLAAAIVELLTNPEKRTRLGQAAYGAAAARFSQDNMLSQTAEVYRLLVDT